MKKKVMDNLILKIIVVIFKGEYFDNIFDYHLILSNLSMILKIKIFYMTNSKLFD